MKVNITAIDMKRIEARDSTGRVMACWPMDELDRAKRFANLSESPWTLGVSEFESDAEADGARLDWIGQNAFYWHSGEHHTMSVRKCIDATRNAPKPTWTPIANEGRGVLVAEPRKAASSYQKPI